MQITRLDNPTEYVLALAGEINRAQVSELRFGLIDAVNRAETDVLIDTHNVTVFDDAAILALAAARTRAKYLRHRIVVLDSQTGAVAASLRRTGLRFRFPVHPDATTAARCLAADREALMRRTLPHHDHVSTDSPAPTDQLPSTPQRSTIITASSLVPHSLSGKPYSALANPSSAVASN